MLPELVPSGCIPLPWACLELWKRAKFLSLPRTSCQMSITGPLVLWLPFPVSIHQSRSTRTLRGWGLCMCFRVLHLRMFLFILFSSKRTPEQEYDDFGRMRALGMFRGASSAHILFSFPASVQRSRSTRTLRALGCSKVLHLPNFVLFSSKRTPEKEYKDFERMRAVGVFQGASSAHISILFFSKRTPEQEYEDREWGLWVCSKVLHMHIFLFILFSSKHTPEQEYEDFERMRALGVFQGASSAHTMYFYLFCFPAVVHQSRCTRTLREWGLWVCSKVLHLHIFLFILFSSKRTPEKEYKDFERMRALGVFQGASSAHISIYFVFQQLYTRAGVRGLWENEGSGCVPRCFICTYFLFFSSKRTTEQEYEDFERVRALGVFQGVSSAHFVFFSNKRTPEEYEDFREWGLWACSKVLHLHILFSFPASVHQSRSTRTSREWGPWVCSRVPLLMERRCWTSQNDVWIINM